MRILSFVCLLVVGASAYQNLAAQRIAALKEVVEMEHDLGHECCPCVTGNPPAPINIMNIPGSGGGASTCCTCDSSREVPAALTNQTALTNYNITVPLINTTLYTEAPKMLTNLNQNIVPADTIVKESHGESKGEDGNCECHCPCFGGCRCTNTLGPNDGWPGIRGHNPNNQSN